MAKRKHFDPDFDTVRGNMFGYDSEDSGVTEQNVKALLGEFFEFEDLPMNEATDSWVAFWRYVHKCEEFWWNYYCGKSVVVKNHLKGQHPGEVMTEWCFPKADSENPATAR